MNKKIEKIEVEARKSWARLFQLSNQLPDNLKPKWMVVDDAIANWIKEIESLKNR